MGVRCGFAFLVVGGRGGEGGGEGGGIWEDSQCGGAFDVAVLGSEGCVRVPEISPFPPSKDASLACFVRAHELTYPRPAQNDGLHLCFLSSMFECLLSCMRWTFVPIFVRTWPWPRASFWTQCTAAKHSTTCCKTSVAHLLSGPAAASSSSTPAGYWCAPLWRTCMCAPTTSNDWSVISMHVCNAQLCICSLCSFNAFGSSPCGEHFHFPRGTSFKL